MKNYLVHSEIGSKYRSELPENLVVRLDKFVNKQKNSGAIIVEIDNQRMIIDLVFTKEDIKENENIQYEDIVILENALSENIEFGFGYDENGNEIEGYCSIGDEVLFKSEKEAILYLLKTDDLFKFVRDCNLNDKVIERYAGSSKDDCSLISYIPYRNITEKE